jgi:amino-acid N-acetyltransferase
MSDPRVTLQRADDLAYVRRLLSRNDLPTDDVGAAAPSFYVGYAEGERVGVGGLETYDRAGLLRSVVVAESARGRGVGTALTGALEDRARAAGVETLYLLTTTAADFFGARGYCEIEREAAPARIRETPQFAQICPGSAPCMRKSLGDVTTASGTDGP